MNFSVFCIFLFLLGKWSLKLFNLSVTSYCDISLINDNKSQHGNILKNAFKRLQNSSSPLQLQNIICLISKIPCFYNLILFFSTLNGFENIFWGQNKGIQREKVFLWILRQRSSSIQIKFKNMSNEIQKKKDINGWKNSKKKIQTLYIFQLISFVPHTWVRCN